MISVVASALGLALYHGFAEPITPAWVASVLQVPLLAAYLGRSWIGARVDASRRESRSAELLLASSVVAAGLILQVRSGGAAAATATGLFLLTCMALDRICVVGSRLLELSGQPARLFKWCTGALLVLALVGTLLLSLPIAMHPATPDYRHNFWRHMARCGFIASSAVSLNGATVYDLAEDIRPFGQVVIYLLMQVGAGFAMVLGIIALRPWLSFPLLLRHVMVAWIAIQIAAIVVTWGHWHTAATSGAQAWWGAFHTAAALNNCGFALRQDGLASYLTDSAVFWTMIVLGWAGSIGLIVVCERIVSTWRQRQVQKASPRGRAGTPAMLELPSVELHLGTWIICLAAAALWFCETPGFLPDQLTSDRPLYLGVHQRPLREIVTQAPEDAGFRTRVLAMLGERWRAALLMSMSARSAGLHVAPLSEGALSWPSWAILIGLMLVGGGVGSAAGGIRTGTFVILFYRRRLNQNGITGLSRIAWRILASMVGMYILGAVILLFTPHAKGWDAFFDAAAIVGNVGWNSGRTMQLTGPACVAMIPLMLAGKLVPSLAWCWIATRLPIRARPVH